MKTLALAAVCVLSLAAGCASAPEAPATSAPAPAASAPAADNRAALSGMREMRMAFDLTDANPEVLMRKLDAIETTRKQLLDAGVTPKIVMTFRGGASYYTQLDLAKVKEADRAEALRVRAKLRQLAKSNGVESLEQCNIPVQQLKIKPADLMPEVKLVGNGWISLAGYQARGYSYISP